MRNCSSCLHCVISLQLHMRQVLTLIDWMERGVFPALEAQYLRKLEFLIVKPGDVDAAGDTIT